MRVIPRSVPAAALLVAVGAAAQVEMGPELQVSTTTTGTRTSSAVAVRPDGDFVVVWDSDQNYTYPEIPDTSSFADVFLRRFTADGTPLGPEMQVNLHTIASQEDPAIAPRTDGGFVITWQSGCIVPGDAACSPDGDQTAVAARIFDAQARGGPELLVNASTTGRQYHPAIATASGDGFFVTWSGYDAEAAVPDGYPRSIFGRTFDAAGTPTSDEARIPATAAVSQSTPVAAADAAGRFVVVWSDVQGARGYEYRTRVLVRRLDAGGAALADPVIVADREGYFLRNPSVAVASDGAFVVAWNEGTADDDIVARRFDPDGHALGDEIAVNEYTTGSQGAPRVAADAAGNFVVVWSSADSRLPPGRDSDVFGRAFGRDGTPVGGEFAVNVHTTGFQGQPNVASDAAGDFVVSWSHLGDFYCVDYGDEPCGIRAREVRFTPCAEDAACDQGCLLGAARCVQGGCVAPPGCPRIVVADARPSGADAALDVRIVVPVESPGHGPVTAVVTARLADGHVRGRCRRSRTVARLRSQLDAGESATLALSLDRPGLRCLADAPDGVLPLEVRVRLRRRSTPIADLSVDRLWTR